MKELKIEEEGFSSRVEGKSRRAKNAGRIFGRKMNNTEKMRKSKNNELKYGISKTRALQFKCQRTLNEHRAIRPHVTRLRYDPKCHLSRSENITS